MGEQASDGIFLTDSTGRYVAVNSAGCQMFGYNRDEILQLSIANLVSPEEVERIAPELALMKAGKPVRSDWRFRRKDGTIFEGEVHGRQLADGRFLGVVRDITERKRAEEALRVSEARTRAILLAIPDLMFRMNADGVILDYFAPHAEELYVPPETFLGKRMHDVLPGPVGRLILENLQRTFATRLPQVFQYELDLPQKGLTVFEARMTLCNPAEAVILVRNITERKQAERALRESEARFRTLVENAPEVIVVLDVELGRFIEVNDNAVRLFSLSREALLQTGPIELSPPNQPDGRPSDVAGALWIQQAVEGQTPVFEWIHVNATGKEFPCEVRLVRLPASGRTLVRGSVTDITERKRQDEKRSVLEAQLAQAQKMEAVGQLAGGVAHDFNNLLTVISGYCELLRALLPSTGANRAMLEGIYTAGERAAALTRQLLTFSRQQIVEPRVLDLNAIVTDTEKLLRRLIGEDISLETVLQPTLAHVTVDPGQITQVIMNLAVNARDAMPAGGKLTIETGNVQIDESFGEGRPGSYVLLAVTDTGTGMTPEVRSRIFEPFFTTKGPGKGTGLGLATVRTIAEQCRGFLSVYSEVGRGSTFKMYFPISDSSAAEELAGPARSTAGGTETVLLVEDEEAVRSVTRRILQELGYSVLEASGGAEAVRIAESHSGSIELLLTDVVMPDIGGRKLAELLTAVRPEMKVLYLSGYTDDAVVRHGVLHADVAFLQKPFTVDALSRKIRQTLDTETHARA